VEPTENQWNERPSAGAAPTGDSKGMFQPSDLDAAMGQAVAERTRQLTAENERLRKELAERRRRERIHRAVFQISEAVHTVEDLGSLYARIHGIVESLMAARNFYIAVLDPATNMISLPYFVDEFDKEPPRPRPVGTGLTSVVLRTGKALLVSQSRAAQAQRFGDALLLEGVDVPYVEVGKKSAIWLGIPLLSQGHAFGVMAVQDYENEAAYGENEKQILTFVAEQTALAIRRKRAEQELRDSEARLRESEARFSTAFRASPVFITMSNLRQLRLVEVNEAFVQWMGLSREEIIGRNTLELGLWIYPAERDKFLIELEEKRALRNWECQLRNWRGSVYTMLLSAALIEINRDPHLLVFGLDITQRKQAEAELLRTLAREKELGELRNSFVSMVSHEFRTPLGIIQSSSEILEDYLDQLDPGTRQEHLQSIRKNTRRMAELMEEVLLLGRLDAGKMVYKPQPTDLSGTARRLVAEVLSATEQRCLIEFSSESFAGETQADERLVEHILTNLLTNAIKYSEAGRAVRLTLARQGTNAVFTITDQGIGIPAEDQEWLFSAFHRGRNVGDRAGTGLGLVIVKRCVDLHRGSIAIRSQAEHGTTVTVRLPVFMPNAEGPAE
jgi:PAS domain S-box-containing protein